MSLANLIPPPLSLLPIPLPSKNLIGTVANKLNALFNPNALAQSTSKMISQIAAAGGLARPSRFRVYLNAANIIKNAGIQTAGLNNPFNLANGVLSGLSALPVSFGPGGVSVTGVNPGAIVGAINSFTNKLSALDLSGRLTLFCDQAELPGRAFATSDIRHYGPTYKQPYQSTYSDVSLDFLVGDDMAEKYFFDAWHSVIESPKTQNFSYFKDYTTTIEIDQVSDSPDYNGNDVTYICKLYDAWPIGVDRLYLDYAANDQPHRLRVSFAFRRWVSDQTDFETGSAIGSNINSIKGNTGPLNISPNAP